MNRVQYRREPNGYGWIKRRNPLKIAVRRAFCAGFNVVGFALTWDRSVIGPWS